MNAVKELSLPNYTALAFLQQLGVLDPNQKQINIMESAVLMISDPQQIDPETIRQCVGNDDLAYYFLFVKTNEHCKLKKSEEEFLLELDNELEEEIA